MQLVTPLTIGSLPESMSNSVGKIKEKKTKKVEATECWHEGPVVIGQPCFHVRRLRFGRNVWMAAMMNSRHVWRQSINFDMASRCSLSHTSLVGLATTASIASPSRSWLLSGQQQVVSGEVGEASRPVSLVSTFSALWPAPKAGHLGWGEPGHHRLHQVRPFFSSVWLGQ